MDIGVGISSSNSAANKAAVGPTTFGGVNFGSQNSGVTPTMIALIVGAVVAVVWFFTKSK